MDTNVIALWIGCSVGCVTAVCGTLTVDRPAGPGGLAVWRRFGRGLECLTYSVTVGAAIVAVTSNAAHGPPKLPKGKDRRTETYESLCISLSTHLSCSA